MLSGGGAFVIALLNISASLINMKYKNLMIFSISFTQMVLIISIFVFVLTLFFAPYEIWKKTQKRLEIIEDTKLDEDKGKHLTQIQGLIQGFSTSGSRWQGTPLYEDIKNHNQFERLYELNNDMINSIDDRDKYLKKCMDLLKDYVKKIFDIMTMQIDINKSVEIFFLLYNTKKDEFELKCDFVQKYFFRGIEQSGYVIQDTTGRIFIFVQHSANQNIAVRIKEYLDNWKISAEAQSIADSSKHIDQLSIDLKNELSKCHLILRLLDSCEKCTVVKRDLPTKIKNQKKTNAN
jgi:hypothetical protein